MSCCPGSPCVHRSRACARDRPVHRRRAGIGRICRCESSVLQWPALHRKGAHHSTLIAGGRTQTSGRAYEQQSPGFRRHERNWNRSVAARAPPAMSTRPFASSRATWPERGDCSVGATGSPRLAAGSQRSASSRIDAAVPATRRGGLLRIPPSTPYNMLGFDKVHRAQTRVTIAGGPTVPLVTIPFYVLLKIVAYSDRHEARDPAGVLHCLLCYEEDSERQAS